MKALVLDLAVLLAFQALCQDLHLPPTELVLRLRLPLDGDPPGWRKNNRQNRLSGVKRMIPDVKQGKRMDQLRTWADGWW